MHSSAPPFPPGPPPQPAAMQEAAQPGGGSYGGVGGGGAGGQGQHRSVNCNRTKAVRKPGAPRATGGSAGTRGGWLQGSARSSALGHDHNLVGLLGEHPGLCSSLSRSAWVPCPWCQGHQALLDTHHGLNLPTSTCTGRELHKGPMPAQRRSPSTAPGVPAPPAAPEKKGTRIRGAPPPPRGSPLSLGTLSPSSTGSRKEPERIMPLGLSARERVLPIWEVLYSSKVESWVGMLLERVIRGVVAAVGLTARRRRGRGRVRAGIGVGKRGWERGPWKAGWGKAAGIAVPKQRHGRKAKKQVYTGTWRPAASCGEHRAEEEIPHPEAKLVPPCRSPSPPGATPSPAASPNPSARVPKPSRNM